jgi:hypothetical protein
MQSPPLQPRVLGQLEGQVDREERVCEKDPQELHLQGFGREILQIRTDHECQDLPQRRARVQPVWLRLLRPARICHRRHLIYFLGRRMPRYQILPQRQERVPEGLQQHLRQELPPRVGQRRDRERILPLRRDPLMHHHDQRRKDIEVRLRLFRQGWL